jgi:hypothetical protein
MVNRRDRVVRPAFALVVGAWIVAEALTGGHTGLLYLAPAVVLALPLLSGRYVAEDQLIELAGRAVPRPRRRVLRAVGPRSFARVMQRGGRLVASAMAKRPPPAAPLPRIAA